MTRAVYYNDSEPFVCDWLENLIREKLLPDGVVDRRPIQEVEPKDVQGFTQCHFFAGIGGWAYALQLAGWGDRPVWTGSCPCQPFSAAGKRGSHADERHLWPAWFRLIRECRPVTIFGEQVSGAAGLGWLDAVALDLEAADYAVGACVLGAHSVGAPHKRQRLYFVGDAFGARLEGFARNGTGGVRQVGEVPQPDRPTRQAGAPNGMAVTEHAERGTERQEHRDAHGRNGFGGSGFARLLDDAASARCDGTGEGTEGEARDKARLRGLERGRGFSELADYAGERLEEQVKQLRRGSEQLPTGAFPWACEWLPCRDGKARPVEPGTFPLAHGIPARVGRLRAYGNAIVPQVATAFVSAYMECVGIEAVA